MHHIAFIKCQNRVSYFLPFRQREAKVAPRIQYKSTRTHHTRAYVKKKMATVEQENAGLREEIGNLKEGMEKMAAMMEAMMTAQAEARAQAQAQVQAHAMVFQPPVDIPLTQPIPFVNVSSAGTSQPIPAASTGTPQPIPTATVVSAGIPQSTPFTPAGTTGITQPLVTEFSLNDMTNMYNAGFRPPGFSYTPQHCMPPGYPWGIPVPIDEGGHPGNTENLFPYGQQTTPFYQPGQTFPRATVTYAKPLMRCKKS